MNWASAIAVYTKPQVLLVFLLGIVSGLPLALTGATLTIWLTEAGISKALIGAFAVAATPYTLKFLWSPLVDQLSLPLIGRLGRRRSWLLCSASVLVAALCAMAAINPQEQFGLFLALTFVVTTASATMDIVIDAYRVERLAVEEQGAGAAVAVFGYRIGMLISGAGALMLADQLPWASVYLLMAGILALGATIVLLQPEPMPVAPREKTSLVVWFQEAVVKPFADFTTHRGWWVMLLFVLAFKLGDALAGVMTGPFLIELGFTKTTIAAIVKTYGLAATLFGAFLGGVLIARMQLLRALWLCGVLQMFSNLLFAVLASKGADQGWLTFVITLENLSGGMGTAAFVAYMSSLCRVEYTATQYALLSSLAAAGRTWLSAGSGVLAENMGWVGFFVFTTAAALPGLLLLLILQRYAKPR